MSAISLTGRYVLPAIHLLKTAPEKGVAGFCKREVLTRILAATLFLFQAADSCLNLIAACTLSCCYLVGKITRCLPKALSADRVKCYFKAARDSLLADPFLTFRTFIRPPTPFEKTELLQRTEMYRREPFKTPSLPPELEIDRKAIAEGRLQRADLNLDRDWGVQEFFGRTVVINLDDKPGQTQYQRRLDKARSELGQIGVKDFERFRAIRGATELSKEFCQKINDHDYSHELRVKQGQAGNFLSHFLVIKETNEKFTKAVAEYEAAKQKYAASQKPADQAEMEKRAREVKKYSSVFVIEDDNGFGMVGQDGEGRAKVVLEGAGKNLHQDMVELPKDWSLFYFMAEHGYARNIQSATPRLNRMTYGVCLNAYAVNHTAYAPILDRLARIFKPGVEVRATDHEIAALHNKLNVFVPKEPLAYQSPGESSISGGQSQQVWNGLEPRDTGL